MRRFTGLNYTCMGKQIIESHKPSVTRTASFPSAASERDQCRGAGLTQKVFKQTLILCQRPKRPNIILSKPSKIRFLLSRGQRGVVLAPNCSFRALFLCNQRFLILKKSFYLFCNITVMENESIATRFLVQDSCWEAI